MKREAEERIERRAYLLGPNEISGLIDLTLGHLRHHLTDVSPRVPIGSGARGPKPRSSFGAFCRVR